ncbi:MAG: hypothetical protein HC779_06275 [Phyllobacteriaceae bacterium]|nr:hypothetical protein [Phyllobacteriaceae bacterium]
MNAAAALPQTRRLDVALVARGMVASRARARDAIVRGAVHVNGMVVAKPGALVADSAAITLADTSLKYVSRAALKLVAGLAAFAIDPEGAIALDIGASTGGFTQVLLEGGAAVVHAIDVGHAA